MSKTNKLLDDTVLAEAVRRIVRVGEPQQVILFGSRARGEARASSDYDFLVIEPSTLPRYQRAAKYRRALTGICPSKDIVVWTPDEVAEWREVPNAFITTIMKEGVTLYERPT